MAEAIVLEGTEEDFSQLLLRHGLVARDLLKEARERAKGKGGSIESLCIELLNSKLVDSPAVFEELRTASKVGAACVKCDADHTILYYHAGSRYSCRSCQGLLRIADPMESLTWKPGKKKPKAPAPETASFPAGVGGETMLDLGILGKAEKPSPLPAPETAFPAGVGGETMLDMGSVARSAAPAPLPKEASGDAAFPQEIGGETMLDMGYVGKASLPGPVPPEEALAPRAAAGDPAASEAIYHAYKGIVWQIASGSLGDHQDSEEALQETFRRLFRSLDKFDPKAGRLKAYVAAIARNVCRDLLRSRAKQLGRGVLEQLSEAIVDEAEKAQDPDRVEEILKAAGACLDKRSREIVDWKVKGLRNKEIASKLNLDPGTVSSYLTRSVRTIREHLKKTQHSPDRNGSGRGH